MHPQYHEEVSKIMSKILRHKAVKYGIMGADDSAWLSVDDLARAGRLMGCEQDLIEVAKTSEKPKCAFKAMAASSAPRESTRASSSKPCMVEEIEHQKCTWQDHCKSHISFCATECTGVRQQRRWQYLLPTSSRNVSVTASHQLDQYAAAGSQRLAAATSSGTATHTTAGTAVMKKRSPYEIHFPFPNEPSFVSGKILENKDFLW
jgi:hypothetical protein